MTGTSARETSRPAKRPRPSATDHPTHIAPPVLFRLPSISQLAPEDGGLSGSLAMSHGGLTMAGAGVSTPARPVQAAPLTAAPKPTEAAALEPTLADQMAASHRLLRTLVFVFLLIALAVISLFVAWGGGAAQPGLANDSDSDDHLESLSDLRVPDISKPPVHGPAAHTASLQPAAQSPSGSEANAVTTDAPQLSLDKPKPAAGASQSGGLTLDASDLARKPSAPAAHVQLGTPIPMRSDANSALAASRESSPQVGTLSLPPTTPRYETVSTPSSASSTAGAGSSAATGGSPSLYDGAKKPADPKSDASSELMLSGSNDSEMSLIPNDYNSSLAKPTSAQPVANKSPVPASSSAKPATTEADSLGVTVGAGMSEPEFPKARTTATPDLDVAAISSQFLEYSRKKSATAAAPGTEIVNPYAPAAPAPPTPATAVSTNVGGAYPQSPASAGVPYGTTGAALTPYVRNSPTGAVPSGLGGGQPVAGAMNPAINAVQSPYPTANQVVPPMPSQSPAMTAYPSLSAGAGYPQAAPANAATGYNMAGSNGMLNTAAAGGNGFAIPPRGTAASSAQPGAYGAPAAGPANYAANNYNTGGYKPSAVTSNPYPGGQIPQGMIGQSGYATAPSSDVVGAPPIPVTGTVGFGTSNTR